MKKLITERDDLFVIDNFLSDEQCNQLIEDSEKIGFDEATVNAVSGVLVNKRIRNNDRVIIDDYITASMLWAKLKEYDVPTKGSWFPFGLNERLRFYRYVPGQQFNWHFDGEFRRNEKETSRLTFMVYLNGDCEGGTTDFTFKQGTIRDTDEVISISPEKGKALVFTHNVLHRGAPVTSGKKYVLRSDIMYKQGD